MEDVIRYFRQFRKFIGRKIYFVLFLMLIVGFAEGVGVTLFLPVLQDGFGNDKLSQVLKFVFDSLHISYSFAITLIFILAFFILRAIFVIFYGRYLGRLLANLRIELRRKMLDKVFTADYLYLLFKKELGYINNALIREITRVVDAFKNFAEVLKNAFYSTMYIALSLLFNFKVTIIAVGLSPIIFILMRRINAQIGHVSRQLTFSSGKFHSIAIQCLSKLKYLKATSSDTKISKIIEKENRNLGDLRYRLFFLQFLSKHLLEPIIVLAVVSLLFYYVVILKRNVSEVMFLVFLFMQVIRQLINAQSSYRKFIASMGSIEAFNNFSRELEENKEDLNPDGILPDFNKGITLKDVTVIFPNGKKALDNVNIDIKPKSVVAFVGHSGSGKSTIANMITGIVKPTEGEILFGDTRYNRLNLKALRADIGYVTQEDVIFNASIKDNVSLWGKEIDENRLTRIIEMAHITGFVNDLPGRQDSMLGDSGLDISGGQRQRVTIARELYKDTKLLILDEATSSLDSKSEKQIYENLKEFKGSKTMIVIAHRLSTVKNADYICVLDDGKVSEKGTYDDLYQKRGEFKKMIDDQLV